MACDYWCVFCLPSYKAVLQGLCEESAYRVGFYIVKSIERTLKALVIIAVISVGAVQSASAASLSLFDGTSVGSVDAIYASAKLKNSGEKTELAWVQSFFVDEIAFDGKLSAGDMSWLDVYEGGSKSTDVFAMGIDDSVEFYLVKTGNGSSLAGSPTHFLFDNAESSSWAVINLALMGFNTSKVSISKISHVTNFASVAVVPVPAAFWLFGSALFGSLVMFRRRRNQ